MIAMVWAWVQARNDPAIDAAFQNRVADPRTYQRVLNKLAGEFGDKFRKFQSEAEIDHAAISAAVRDAGGKIQSDPPVRLGRLSDQEYRQHVRETYGYDPG